MEHMGYLSTLPQADPAVEASQTQIITYTLPEPLDLTTTPARILIEEAPNLLAAGSNVGLRTWEASLHLAQYLHTYPGLVRGKNVLELGAGTGLVSILCAGPLRAKMILSTDGLPHVVESMQRNIDRNTQLLPAADTDSSPIEARVLDWASIESLEDTLTVNDCSDYDLIIGADITYSPDVVPILAQLLKILMVDMFATTEVQALISGTVRNKETLAVFRKACMSLGLLIEDVTFQCPSTMEQLGFFHEQAFPIVIMQIRAS